MLRLLVLVFCLPLITNAQSNYFVSDGNLSIMRPAFDTGYIGGSADSSIVKLDENFELIWAIGAFKGILVDLVVDPESGLITTVHKYEEVCKISQITNDGVVMDRVAFSFGGDVEDAEIELTSTGFAFAFNAFIDVDSTERSVIVGATDEDLSFNWIKSYETPETFTLKELDLVVYDDSLAVLSTGAKYDTNYSVFSQFKLDGTFIGATKLGNDCGYYRDLEHLPGGGFVAVGEVKRDEEESLRVSVLDGTGTILATKQTRTSGSDLGWNRATVSVLSDGRYVVCNNYYEGHGGYNQGQLIFFDNHKPVKRWEYKPIGPIGEDRDDFNLWCVDNADQLIFSAKVQDESYWSVREFTMGRMTWISEDCEIGTYYGSSMDYGIDTSFIVDPLIMSIDSLPESIVLDPLSDKDYTNVFLCSNAGFDLGPEVEDDHLFGGRITNCLTVEEIDEVDDSGIDEHAINYTLFPNPSAGIVFLSSYEVTQVKIYDLQGQLLETVIINDNTTSLELGSASGLYLLELYTANGKMAHTKIIKD